jgi:hypothetical protein
MKPLLTCLRNLSAQSSHQQLSKSPGNRSADSARHRHGDGVDKLWNELHVFIIQQVFRAHGEFQLGNWLPTDVGIE